MQDGSSARGYKIAAFFLTTGLLGIVNHLVKPPMLLAERLIPGAGAVQIICAGFYSAWLTGLFMNPENSLKFRPRVWMLFSVVFFAQLFLGLAGIEKMLMTGKLHLPLPALIIA